MKTLRSSGDIAWADGNASAAQELQLSSSVADWTSAIANGADAGLLAWVAGKAANSKGIITISSSGPYNVVGSENNALFVTTVSGVSMIVPEGLPIGFRFRVIMDGASSANTWIGFIGGLNTIHLPRNLSMC